MKKIFMVLLAVVISVAGFSQTKRIAHRSHSGKNNEFSINGEDNFGLPPAKKTKPDTTKAPTKTRSDTSVKTTASKKVITKARSKKPKTTSSKP